MLLGIDQGTSGTTCLVISSGGEVVAQSSRALASSYPQPGWVEQDPAALLASVVESVAEVLERSGGPAGIQAVGLANQGESVIAWDAASGEPLSPVLVWSDQRAASIASALEDRGQGTETERESGLRLSSYFSAPKLQWLLTEHPEVRAAARRGSLRLGTLDAWLGVRLGAPSLTDPSTASRTQLYALDQAGWSAALMTTFGVPPSTLPTILPSAHRRGELVHPAWGGPLPWTAGCVDQVAGLLGCGCLEAGQVKVTYGTGAFVLAHAGSLRPPALPGLLCSAGVGEAIGQAFVLDGGVFTAGTAINWLRRLGLLSDPAQASQMAYAAQGSVRFLPAFGGIGAPWWQPDARGVFSGLTDASTPEDLVKAVLDGIAQRVADIVEAMRPGLPQLTRLRVDGGLSRIDYLLERQAALTGLCTERAASSEATALGVALLAGVAAGVCTWGQARTWLQPQQTITPVSTPAERQRERSAWQHWRDQATLLR